METGPVGDARGCVTTRTALITGIAGQDGSYLAELLLGKGYHVLGLDAPGRRGRRENIEHLLDRIELISGDLSAQDSMIAAITEARPDEVYNLGAQSSSVESFRDPVRTGDINGLGPVRILDAIRRVSPRTRFFQASSAEMFGKAKEYPQRLTTPFEPVTPYGAAKLYAHWMVAHFRSRHGIYAVSGILFNHESPRRGLEFVTRKIAHAAAAIKRGVQRELRLGDLDAARDWGFAGDFVRAMWLSLQQEEPRDYLIATGEPHTVREFVEEAFLSVGLDWKKHITLDKEFVRHDEGYRPCGDASLARTRLGWNPETSFRELVRMMVEAELQRACRTSQ